MRIRFLNHALRRMEERDLSPSFVADSIRKPDKIDQSLKDTRRFLFKKRYSRGSSKERLLIIVAEKDANTLVIVTIIDTSKIEKYW